MKKLTLIPFLLISTILQAQTYGWSELGTGSNTLNANNDIYTTCTDAANNVYAAGRFTNSNGKMYVAKWNGTSWNELGNGNNALKANNAINSICKDANGNIYAAGVFTDSPVSTKGNEYVAKWNGTTWSKLGTGVNELKANNQIIAICADANNNIYATGAFTDMSNNHFVAKWNGTSWSELGQSGNPFTGNSMDAICTDASGNIYIGGKPNNTYNVAKWDGSSWIQLGTGSAALNESADIMSVCADLNGNIYAAGFFENTSNNSYVAKWNGSNWTELGTGSHSLKANGAIYSICVDSNNNVYACGAFTNSAGKNYVAVWDGADWAELGTGANALNATIAINSVCSGANGKVYAGGIFIPSANGYTYVAQYIPDYTAVNKLNKLVSILISPNPSKDFINIDADNTILGSPYFIIDITGKILTKGQLQNARTQIDISKLQAGLYLLQIGNAEKEVFKIVKD